MYERPCVVYCPLVIHDILLPPQIITTPPLGNAGLEVIENLITQLEKLLFFK